MNNEIQYDQIIIFYIILICGENEKKDNICFVNQCRHSL